MRSWCYSYRRQHGRKDMRRKVTVFICVAFRGVRVCGKIFSFRRFPFPTKYVICYLFAFPLLSGNMLHNHSPRPFYLLLRPVGVFAKFTLYCVTFHIIAASRFACFVLPIHRRFISRGKKVKTRFYL